ncbi:hypothetical protein HS9_00587 [Bacillus velezensis]|nr:hypothetical protein HS9_00587 [Bacillus velezensis]
MIGEKVKGKKCRWFITEEGKRYFKRSLARKKVNEFLFEV